MIKNLIKENYNQRKFCYIFNLRFVEGRKGMGTVNGFNRTCGDVFD